MKKMIFSAIFFTLFFQQQIIAQELKSEFLFDLEISLSKPLAVGPVLTGRRTIFPFEGGTVKGEKINGKLTGPGAEWGLTADSNTFKVDVRTTETSAPKYLWLNHTLAVGVGRFPAAGKVAYRIYEIK